MTVTSTENVCYYCVFQNDSAERQSSIRRVCTSCQRKYDGEGVNRRTRSGRTSVVDRDSLRDAI